MNVKPLWCSAAAESLANVLRGTKNVLLYSSEFPKQAALSLVSSVGKSRDRILRPAARNWT